MDFNYLHQYAEETAQELSDKFFQDKFIIEGNALVDFCSVKQINFFILKNLFEEWERETAQLKSPFFDFDHADVKQALGDFMEKLSFHIRMEKKDFLPLLEGAIEETILLVLAPAEYLRSVIVLPNEEFIHLKNVRNQAKYTKMNNHVLLGVIDNMVQKNKSSILVDEIKPVLNALLEDESNHYNHEQFLDEINDLFPLDVVQLLGAEETIGETEELEVPAININEALKGEEKRSLNEELNQGKITSLKTAFGLNQRYLFINKLFKGQDGIFAEAIAKVDQFTSYDEAVNHLLDNYSEKFEWGNEEDTVTELFQIIDRRF